MPRPTKAESRPSRSGIFGSLATRRSLYLIAAAAVLAGLWMWQAKRGSTMVISVLLAPEGGQAQTRRFEVPFPRSGRRPVATLEVDLSAWQGKLVRLELDGKLPAHRGRPIGFVGYSASVVEGTQERPIEFVGWENDGKERVHPGRLGPIAFRGPERDGRAFVYGRDGHLWYVLPVRGQERLKLAVTPVLTSDVKRLYEPYVPRAPAPWLPPAKASFTGGRRAPDIFVYLIDAQRADRLGCYGYWRPTSPNIDAFAAGAVIYENAYAAASWTRPSVASILTGLYPLAHGVVHMEADRLDEWPVTVPEALRAAGYRTMHVCANGYVSGHYGFLQGVDRSAYGRQADGAWANDRVAEFLEGEDPNRPVFMYVHVLGSHDPYTPKPETRRLLDRGFGIRGTEPPSLGGRRVGQPVMSKGDLEFLRDLYDGEVRDSDALFKDFLDLLRRAGRLDNALIVVTADHGESFLEHGTMGHGRSLNVEELRVPLIIRYPAGRDAGKRVATRVSLVDLYPTVVAAAGARPRLDYALPGRDLAPLAQSPGPQEPVFAEVSQHDKNGLDLVTVIDEVGYQRVFDMSAKPGALTAAPSIGLWDTRADPAQKTDLRQSLPVREAYCELLAGRYLMTQRWWRGSDSTGTTAAAPPLTEAMREQLKALGYLE